MIIRRCSIWLALLTAALLPACGRRQSGTAAPATATPAPAGESGAALAGFPAPADGGSPHFAKVVGRLDVGGKMIQFQDHDGTRDLFIELVNAFLSVVPELKAGAEIDPAGLVDATGLAQAAASGRSVIRDGDAWLMRGYTYLPKGPGGLSSLLGNEPVPFQSPAFIPAATDLVIETRLDASSLPALVLRLGAACGQEAAAREFLAGALPVGDSMQGVMEKTDLHLILGVDVSSWAAKPLVPGPVDYFLRVQGASGLLPLLLPELEKTLGPPLAIGTRKGWEVPLPAIGMQAKGVLAYDEEGTLILASRKEYLAFVETAKVKLAGLKEYQAATNHFPSAGNFLFYASPQVPAVLGWAIRQAADASEEEGAAMIAKATDYLLPRSYSFCAAYEADGIATTAELPFAADANLGSMLPVLTATSTLFIGARAWKTGSDRAACILNTRNVQQAVRSYQNLHDIKDGATIPWGEIVGPKGLLTEMPKCLGGTYTFAKTMPQKGKLACSCDNPEHAVPDHSNW